MPTYLNTLPANLTAGAPNGLSKPQLLAWSAMRAVANPWDPLECAKLVYALTKAIGMPFAGGAVPTASRPDVAGDNWFTTPPIGEQLAGRAYNQQAFASLLRIGDLLRSSVGDGHSAVVVDIRSNGSGGLDVFVVDNVDGVTTGTNVISKHSLFDSYMSKYWADPSKIFVSRMTEAEAFNGTSRSDLLAGSAQADVVRGYGGGDRIVTGGGDDRILVAGTEGMGDLINAGAGNDTLVMLGTGPVSMAGLDARASSIEVIEASGQWLMGTNGADTFDLRGITLIQGKLAFIDGGDGNDTILGTAFQDEIRGGRGADTLTGGSGAVRDVFKWTSIDEAGVGAGRRDTVTDFQTGIDKLDLSMIDANSILPGNQAFIFTTSSTFGLAPQMARFSGGSLFLNIDGGGSDAEIRLTGVTNLTARDIIL